MERITDLMTSQSVLNNLTNDLDQLTTTSNQLSSGLSITQPSDNPYGATVALQLQSAISSLGQYSTNVQDATATTTTAQTALTDMSNIVATARQLVVEGGNGSMSQADLSGAASQVNGLIGELKQAANTTYNGSYIFSGTASTTAPYLTGATDTYQGNNGTVSSLIGPGTSVQVNVNISGLLGNGQPSGDGLLLDTLRTISSDLSSGNTNALQGADLQNVDKSAATVEQMQAQVGGVSDQLTQASATITAMTTDDQQALANDEDVDIAQATTAYSNEQAAYTAALKAGSSIVQSSLLDFLSNA